MSFTHAKIHLVLGFDLCSGNLQTPSVGEL